MKSRPIAIIAIASLLVCSVALALSRGFYATTVNSLFFSVILLSVSLIHFAVRPVRDVVWVLALTVLLAFLEFYVLHFSPGLVPLTSLLGMSSLTILGAATLWDTGEQRKVLQFACISALLFVASDWLGSALLNITSALHPKTLDLYLYSFEASLGVQPSFIVGKWFLHLAWLRAASLPFYIGLPIVMALVYGQQLRSGSRAAVAAMIAFLITGPVGVLFYNILPATGPVHVFGSGFPLQPLSMSEASRLLLVPIQIAAARNAIPSLHMAWVLLAWWNSRGLALWCRAIAFVFVLFTVLATLGTGEHYFVDLVVAIPFAVMIQAMAAYTVPLSDRKRSLPLMMGLLMIVGWFALLSFGVRAMWISPVIPWSLLVLTVVGIVPLQRHVMLLVYTDCSGGPDMQLKAAATVATARSEP